MHFSLKFVLFSATAIAQVKITTPSVPTATQYQPYGTTLTATGGTPPYTWSVVTSSGVSLPEGMSLDASTGVVSATQVSGQGGYAVTIQVSDKATPTPNTAQATINFGVMSDGAYDGCQMFPADSIYNQRIDLLPLDRTPSHQIAPSLLAKPLHPDFGHGFYPGPGGIPFMRVPSNQTTTHVNLANDGQIDQSGTYSWPFPPWPNAVIEGTSYGAPGDDHHTLILQSSVANIAGPQTGPCTLYETYQSTAVQSMYNPATNMWSESAGVHYVLNSNAIATSTSTLDRGAQDSAGIPIVPLLMKYSEVPLGVNHPLRIVIPSPTNGWVWPGTGCCSGSGPPQGLLYRLKANVNWKSTCPVATAPQAATVLQALQQYGAYMSDHGSAGYIQGVPDVRWNDDDLACIRNFHMSDFEVVDNSVLMVSPISGQTKPYIAIASLPNGAVAAPYSAAILATGGSPANWLWSVSAGSLPPGLSINTSTGVISGTPTSASGSPFNFSVMVTDAASGNVSQAQPFSITVIASTNSVTVASVTNAASGAVGAIAPGEIVAIKGSGLGPANSVLYSSSAIDPNTGKIDTTLAGVRVFFGSLAAPILYASATQINAIVPYEAAGYSQLAMQVQYQGVASSELTLSVTGAAPGAFTFDATGTGQVIAANQDGSFNSPSSRAPVGSLVTVYFTGGGPTDPAGVTGSVTGLVIKSLTQNTLVTVGGIQAAVLFAGAAPTLVDGVNQLNINMADNTPRGEAQPLVIIVGANASPSTATLAVQ